MQKLNWLTLVSALTLAPILFTVKVQAQDYQLYLVRHAEKQKDQKNPHLTACGQLRANQLAKLLSKAEIKKIYSTSYNRTLETATPLSAQQKVAITHYAPQGLSQLARTLKQNKQNALIVGHSNTTPQLLSLLTGKEEDKISEQEYQWLYQVNIVEDKVQLTKLIQPLQCR